MVEEEGVGDILAELGLQGVSPDDVMNLLASQGFPAGGGQFEFLPSSAPEVPDDAEQPSGPDPTEEPLNPKKTEGFENVPIDIEPPETDSEATDSEKYETHFVVCAYI